MGSPRQRSLALYLLFFASGDRSIAGVAAAGIAAAAGCGGGGAAAAAAGVAAGVASAEDGGSPLLTIDSRDGSHRTWPLVEQNCAGSGCLWVPHGLESAGPRNPGGKQKNDKAIKRTHERICVNLLLL